MKSKEILKEEIVKKEYLPFKITETKTTSAPWSSIIIVDVEDPNNEINRIQFHIQETISGCGLCVISGVTNIILNTKERQQAFKRCLEQLLQSSNVRSGTSQKGCVIATLGQQYISAHESGLLEAGFVKIHTYDNIAHSQNSSDRHQSIYLLDIIRK